MEQNIFSFQQKCLATKIILHFIDLFTPSFIFVLHLSYLSIIGKDMLNGVIGGCKYKYYLNQIRGI